MTGDDEASGDGGANDGGDDDDAEAAGADGAGPPMGSAASADGKSGDACLMEAMEALKGSDAAAARTLLSQAWRAYEAEGGPSTEQAQLLEMVGARVDAAVMPGFGKTTAPRPPPPSEDELRKRAEAKAAGEKKLMETVSVFGDKTDEGRFAKAFKLLEEAREAYRAAGSDVEREREPVLGNLYAVVRAEEERTQRVAKLVRMKRLLELTKQKKKAEALGIDPDLLERGEEEEDGEGEGEGGARGGGGGGGLGGRRRRPDGVNPGGVARGRCRRGGARDRRARAAGARSRGRSWRRRRPVGGVCFASHETQRVGGDTLELLLEASDTTAVPGSRESACIQGGAHRV